MGLIHCLDDIICKILQVVVVAGEDNRQPRHDGGASTTTESMATAISMKYSWPPSRDPGLERPHEGHAVRIIDGE